MRSTFKLLYFVKRNAVKKERQRTDYRTYHYRPSCSPVQYQAGNKSGSLEREVRQGFRKNHRSRTHQFHAGEYSQHGTPTLPCVNDAGRICDGRTGKERLFR